MWQGDWVPTGCGAWERIVFSNFQVKNAKIEEEKLYLWPETGTTEA